MRKGLLHQEGGDRVMSKVLAEVPKQGLDAVLVAVELALESAPPSGRVMVHVNAFQDACSIFCLPMMSRSSLSSC